MPVVTPDSVCSLFNYRFDTSAKLNTNIDKAARFLVSSILSHNDIFAKKAETTDAIRPTADGMNRKSKGGCC